MQEFIVESYVLGPGMEKSASSGRDECARVMREIYNENPHYWPYGLDISNHQSVYLIRDKMTKQAAGFVGWQVFHEYPNRKIGSYSIGILPQYRGNGYASEAVAKVLQEKAASVDEVRCYAMPDNEKSKGLAKKLHIPVKTEF